MNRSLPPCTLKTWALAHKRVLLRADLNVPLDKNQTIINDYRLQMLKPTLDFLLDNDALILLATHLGRPKNHDPSLSTKHLIPWFKKEGYTITFSSTLDNAYQASIQQKKGIILLENMRFFPGEKEYSAPFAQELAQLGDYYVNDAFGLLHRTDTSLVDVPLLFNPEKRSIGFLVEKELSFLTPIRTQPPEPFVIFLGGGKVHDKLPFLKEMIHKKRTIVLCPAPVFTFLYAQGKPVGKSLVDYTALETCKEFIRYTKEHKTRLYFPKDYLVAQGSFDGPLYVASEKDFPSDAVGISIGPKTLAHFTTEVIAQAKTIFYNGLMGSVTRPETLAPINALFNVFAASNATTIIGGGDSVAAAQLCGVADRITHLSTGGGATLAYISGQSMPGLAPFLSP